MTDEELTALIFSNETERLERKEKLSDLDKAREAICAFANDLSGSGKPGVFAVGVDDSGKPCGLMVDDELLLKLAHLRDDGTVVPFPSVEIRKLQVDGGDIAVAIVQPHSNPPVAVRGRIYIRVGPRRAIASPDEERRLTERRRLANLPFDSRPLPSASVEDLNLEAFRNEILPQVVAPDVLADNHRPLDHQLASLRFTTPDRHATPTGILICSDDPENHLPGAYLQFNRYDGLSLADPILNTHRISGPLPQLMLSIDEVVRANIETRVMFEGRNRDSRRPDAPFVAVQQLIRNALIHRTYEGTNAPVRVLWFKDRIEIQSPGGPFGQVTPETFGQSGVTDYRNPSLAGVLGQLGYVQQFGVGIETARTAMSANGNPNLELQPRPQNVLAVVSF